MGQQKAEDLAWLEQHVFQKTAVTLGKLQAGELNRIIQPNDSFALLNSGKVVLVFAFIRALSYIQFYFHHSVYHYQKCSYLLIYHVFAYQFVVYSLFSPTLSSDSRGLDGFVLDCIPIT